MEQTYQIGDHEITMNVPEECMITNIVLIAQVQSIEGAEGVIVTWPKGTSGVAANGLLLGAYHVHANHQGMIRDDEA